ncbi:hypothetical protein [Moorena sp. SIO3I8]|uniref:hypothetical protein n=1 Tax=Moorena sp. SIO3I8 TaxID=2607833 RepID=UPI0013BF9960|nr:hypothetical protein [Moorena sp. SIO3I8]NEO08776.1 hypothetical protein [Moorena sp. SIO3I8]
MEPSDSITSSPKQENLLSDTLTDFLQDYAIGRRSEIVDEELLKRTLEASPLIKWVTFPILFQLLSTDDKAKFCDMLVQRDLMYRMHKYPRFYLHLRDIFMLADLLRCYVSDVIGIVITIKLIKK